MSPSTIDTESSSKPVSPMKQHIKKVIEDTLSPQIFPLVEKALQNAHKRRKRVQSKAGEVLTQDTALARLAKEANIEQRPTPEIIKVKGDGNCLFASVALGPFRFMR